MPNVRLLAVLVLGVALRIALLHHAAVAGHAATRLELATPVTSWKTLQEGVYLHSYGLDPYAGSVFRQAPLLLAVFSACPERLVPFLYALADLGTALAIVGTARAKHAKSPTTSLQSWWIALLVLFNPLGLLTSVAKSATSFSNLAIAVAVYGASTGSITLATSAFSIAMHLSCPTILLPAFLLLLKQSQPKQTNFYIRTIASLVVQQVSLLLASYMLLGSWSFLKTYVALLTVQDLTPNVGLYWYFFIEMFDHFRNFFLLVFQAHLSAYAMPICLKLQYDPLLAFTVLSGIQATFKSYPTVGDAALYHSLLAFHPELVSHMRYPLFTIMAHLYTILLLPTFHHLWLYAGSGNSNFYYASTLVWALASGLGVLDTLTAALKQKFLHEQRAKGHPALKGSSIEYDTDKWSLVQR